MPKEITHWAIASHTASQCDTRLRGIIEKNFSLYLAGAVAVDSPYYVVSGDAGGLLKQAGARLHGMGAQTSCEVVSQVIDIVNGVDGDETLAFTLGALTHLIADSIFHPMIYYLTGDYDDQDSQRRKKAVTRHRTLETWIDVWFAERLDARANRTFLRHAAGAVIKTKSFGRLASALFFGRDDMSSTAMRAVASHAVIQSLFYSRMAATLTAFYGRIGRVNIDEFNALFYPPPGMSAPPFLSAPIRYENPVTGETFEKTLENLENDAVNACVRLFDVAVRGSDSGALAEECARTVQPMPKDRKFVHFASEKEMDELWRDMSFFRTHG